MQKYLEFLALARLADWLQFPVGVLEKDTPDVNVFTVVIQFPTGLMFRRIPRSHMLGSWFVLHNINLEDLQVSQSEADHRLERIIVGNLIRTIKTIE